MKILSVAIPCYNSAQYMEKCIHSLLPGGERVEIIIVDDGSQKDNTAQIADWYEKKYPSIIKAVHQENGGHGQAVNTGLKNSTGVYFKVVDSDDCVDLSSYLKILDVLEELHNADNDVDMMLSNYVYDKEGARHKKVMRYSHNFPQNRVFGWDEMRAMHTGKYILMHSVIYRTEMLKTANMVLPKHTFYVDNIFVYYPLPHVKRLYYIDVNFYKYYIGREDQSVNEKVMINRIDQQLRVTKIMIDSYDLDNHVSDPKVKRYMYNYLDIMMGVSSIMLILSHNKENLQKKAELWDYLKKQNGAMYHRLRHTPMGIAMNLPGKTGRFLSEILYRLAQKIYGFN